MSNRGKGKKKQRAEPAPAVRPENYPTPEFERHVTTAIELYRTKVVAGRDKDSEAWRVVPQIEMMHRQGRLTWEEVKAANTFYRDFVFGHRVGGLTARYGELTAYGGTPLAQQERDIEGPDGMSPEERRAYHQGKFAKACLAVWKAGVPLRVIEMAIRLLCEIRLADEQRLVSLRDLGEYMGYAQSQQQQASGATYLQLILRNLAIHYDYTDYERPKGGRLLRLQ